jgi:hypothetical protein
MSELTATAHGGYVHLDVPDDRSMLTYAETIDLVSRLQCAAREALNQGLRAVTAGLDGRKK